MQNPLYNHPSLWQTQLPRPDARSHKYTRGAVLIYGGYPITGAARLAAMAAARCGAGITTLAVPESAFIIYATACLSIMVKPYRTAQELHELIAQPRITAQLIGPGAGVSEQTREATLKMLASEKPVVIDADAISSLNANVSLLKKKIIASCVLTPHDGEFARLFGKSAGDTLETRLQSAQDAASLSQAIVVLKGAQTIIATPDGRLLINQNAPPTLATAGAGDVLAGIIVSLLAQGMPAFEASAAAVWIHAEAAKRFGIGLIADDIPNLIPKVIAAFASA